MACGDDVQIGVAAVISRDAAIGDGVVIGDGVLIDQGVTLGAGVVIGDRTFIGRNTEIPAGVAIGSDCQVDRNVVVVAGVRIGDRNVVEHKSSPVTEDLPDTCLQPLGGMAAWLPGDGHALDLVAGAHGTLFGDAGYADGLVGGPAFWLDGYQDWVDLGDVQSLEGIAQMTMELWFRADAMVGIQIPVAKSDGSTVSFQVAICPDGKPGAAFSAADGTYSRHTSDAPVPAGERVHYVAVYDSSLPPAEIVRTYVDGELQSGLGTSPGCVSSADTGIATGQLLSDNAGPLTLGARNDYLSGHPLYFGGRLDEVRFWTRALSQGEVLALYGSEMYGVCKD